MSLKRYAERYTKWFYQNKHWFDLAREALTQVHQAREGGFTSKVLAGTSILGLAVTRSVGQPTPARVLSERGYHLIDTVIGGFLSEIIEREEPVRKESFNNDSELRFWGKNEEVAFLYNEQKYDSGPFIRGDDQILIEQITRCIWSNERDLQLVQKLSGWYYKAYGKFDLAPVQQPGPYIGKRTAKDYLQRLRRYGDQPRTILIEGPSGVGKSVLARHIATAIAGCRRTLRMPGRNLQFWNPNELPQIVKYLQPAILLIDDVNLSSDSKNLLEIFESLRVDGRTTIVTRMIDVGNAERKPGGMYIEGMRPGRIDEVITLRAPSREDRELILRHYFGHHPPSEQVIARILNKTDGLTGAYLAEIAGRITFHGEESWEEEVDEVLYFAPPPPEEESEEDEDSP